MKALTLKFLHEILHDVDSVKSKIIFLTESVDDRWESLSITSLILRIEQGWYFELLTDNDGHQVWIVVSNLSLTTRWRTQNLWW